jgi:hypothetical protein
VKKGDAVPIDARDRKLRAAWEPMKLDDLGRLTDVIQQGGGKLSSSPGDTGEPRKVPSTG